MKNCFCRKLTAVCVGAMLYGSGLTSASAEAISLDFRNADVRGVFTQIAELGGIGLVMDESVKGRLTISLKDVDPWEAAEIVAMTRGLSISRRGDTLVVTTGGVGGSSLYGVHVFRIENAELDTIAEAVDMAFGGSDDYDDYSYGRERRNDTGTGDTYRTRQNGKDYGQHSGTAGNTVNRRNERLNNRRGRSSSDDDRRVSCDYQTNSLIFYGNSAEAEQVRHMVRELDVPAKQIALEARVLAISKEAAKNLGVQWQWSSVPQYP